MRCPVLAGPIADGGRPVRYRDPVASSPTHGPDRPQPVRTIRLDRELPVTAIGAASGLLWSRDGLMMAGLGRAAEVPIDRPGGHAAAISALAAVTDPEPLPADSGHPAGGPVPGPVAFAAFPFDPDREPGRLLVPRVVIGADRSGRRWLTAIGTDPDPEAELADHRSGGWRPARSGRPSRPTTPGRCR